MEGRQACPLPFGIGAAAVIRYGLTEITIHAHPGRPGHARNAARGNSDTPLSGGVSEDKAVGHNTRQRFVERVIERGQRWRRPAGRADFEPHRDAIARFVAGGGID